MNVELFSAQIGIPPSEVESLLALGRARLYQSKAYKKLVDSLDYDLLSGTLEQVRAAYDVHLPEVVDYLRNTHQWDGNPMTSTTLGNWILGFLHNTTYLSKLPDFHKRVPVEILEAGLPRIIGVLDDIGEAGNEWRKALSLLSLPFFAAD